MIVWSHSYLLLVDVLEDLVQPWTLNFMSLVFLCEVVWITESVLTGKRLLSVNLRYSIKNCLAVAVVDHLLVFCSIGLIQLLHLLQEVDLIAIIVDIRMLLVDLPFHQLGLADYFAKLLPVVVVINAAFTTVQRLFDLGLGACMNTGWQGVVLIDSDRARIGSCRNTVTLHESLALISGPGRRDCADRRSRVRWLLKCLVHWLLFLSFLFF